MSTIDDVAQKIKGKAQHLKGDIEDTTGKEGQGFWDKTKGKVNETIADIKLNARHNTDHDLN